MSKKKYYLVLDTETATLPVISSMDITPQQRQQLAIAKPLVYDLGWIVMDRQGNIVKKENFLIQEIFFVPQVFNTAYYKEKRPIYIDLLNKGEIKTATWNDAIDILLTDLEKVDIACAYNATFDFKKAIPFTERYIKALYGDYNKWEKLQVESCENILNKTNKIRNENFLEPIFTLRNKDFPICDLWQSACKSLINNQAYKDYCLTNGFLTDSGMYFKTSAESTFSYLMKDCNFEESHTALDDSLIESHILTKLLAKGKIEPNLQAFPFRELGSVTDYVKQKPKQKYAPIVIEQLNIYLDGKSESNYTKRIEKLLHELEDIVNCGE